MSVIRNYFNWKNGLSEKSFSVVSNIELGAVLLVGAGMLAWRLTPSKTSEDAQNVKIAQTQEEMASFRKDVAKLSGKVQTFSKRLTAVEEQNLELITIAKGRIPLQAPPEAQRLAYRKSYRKFVKAELGDIPRPVQYWTKPLELPASELRCLALNVYHEAAKEPYRGKVAVAQVTINRFQSGKWGTLCDTVYSKGQFSWTLSPKLVQMRPSGKYWEKSKKVAKDVAKGLRLERLENATHYHADYIPGPKWLREVKVRHYVGMHLFYDRRI